MYPLLEDTDVLEVDETTLLVTLSVSHTIHVSTAPSPASSLLNQLQFTLSKLWGSYRVKAYWADYQRAYEGFTGHVAQLQHCKHRTQASFAAMEELMSQVSAARRLRQQVEDVASGTGEGGGGAAAAAAARRWTDGQESSDQYRLALAAKMSAGEQHVAVLIPGSAEAPRGGEDVLSIALADEAAATLADNRLIDELEASASVLQNNLAELERCIAAGHEHVHRVYQDVIWAIQADSLKVSGLVCVALQAGARDNCMRACIWSRSLGHLLTHWL